MSDLGLPINNATKLTPTDSDTFETPTDWFMASVSEAGFVSVVLASGTTMLVYANRGCSFLRMSVKKVNTTGTTATGHYYNIKVK